MHEWLVLAVLGAEKARQPEPPGELVGSHLGREHLA
jgi:hypothetical protein